MPATELPKASVAVSSDGARQTIVAPDKIYTSNDFGVTWIVAQEMPSASYYAIIAMSADGMRQVARSPKRSSHEDSDVQRDVNIRVHEGAIDSVARRIIMFK